MPTLEFKGKPFVYSHHLPVPFRELIVDPEKSPVAKGRKPSLDDNLIFHGDNLEALKALLPHYAGQVDVIYIDPPYNTGEEGWAYNDNVNSPLMKEWAWQGGGSRRSGAPRQVALHDVAEKLFELMEWHEGTEKFQTPKPVRLISRILKIASDVDSIVMDSFAGSGTTGHAVLAANASDDGNRRFILIETEVMPILLQRNVSDALSRAYRKPKTKC